MKPAPFTYHDPRTLAEAAELIHGLENARVLAGGQSLMPMMHFRYIMPDHVIDLNPVEELSYIRNAGEKLELGAMTRQRDIEFSPMVQEVSPILAEAVKHIGHRQTRNRGTLGGSLCHLDPSAELVNVALLHDAQLTLRRGEATRTVPMSVFARGFMSTVIEEGEFLTAVTLSPWRRNHGYAFEEFARRHGDFAIAAVGALVELTPSGRVDRSAIVVSGLAEMAFRLTRAETLLAGQSPSEELLGAIAEAAERAEAMDDAQASARYRKHLAGVLTRRAVARAVARAGRATYG